MSVERVQDEVFVGLLITFSSTRLLCRAAWGKPGAPLLDAVYAMNKTAKFQDWLSWAPQAQKRGLVLSLIHRCVTLSNSNAGVVESATEVFVSLLAAAGYPESFLWSCVAKWRRAHHRPAFSCPVCRALTDAVLFVSR